MREPMTAPNVELRELPSVPLAVIRRRVAASERVRVVPECCGLVWNALRAQQVQPGRHVTIYWDRDIHLEVGVELAQPFVEEGELLRSATPAGLTAFTAHAGPYDQLRRAHDAIRDWCTARGYRVTGPNWEIYGHWQSAWNQDPSKIRTDVFYQVAN
jgi:effector-binding domain-containing protein